MMEQFLGRVVSIIAFAGGALVIDVAVNRARVISFIREIIMGGG